MHPPLLPPFIRILVLLACLHVSDASARAGVMPREYTQRDWYEQDGLPSDELSGVEQDGDGYLWVATATGLARFDGRTFEPRRVPVDLHTRGLVRLAAARPDGRPVLAIPARTRDEPREAGAYVWQGGRWRFEAEPALGGREPRVLFRTGDGTLWFGCDDGTVARGAGGIFPLPGEAQARRTPHFATDAAGRLWVARAGRLARIDADTWTDVPIDNAGAELRVTSSARGGVWLFTRSALLRVVDDVPTFVTQLPHLLGAHFVQAAFEDSRGQLWIATRSQGLFRFVDGAIVPVSTSGENIVAVTEDSEGNIWAASDGGGLSRLRPRAHRLYDDATGLKDRFSYTVAEDTAGAIWLANRDGGVARVTDGTVDPISIRAGWRPFSAMSVHPAPDGSIWITSGLGIYRTTAHDPERIEKVSTLGALRSVRSTFVSRQGDYWMADSGTLARYRNGSLLFLDATRGFDGNDVRAFAEDAEDRVWIGAGDGRLYRTAGDRVERVELPGSREFGALQVIRFEPDGTLLIGTTRYGVVVVPRGEVARTRMLYTDHGLPWNNITQILVDDHDRHWFASRAGIGWVHSHEVRAWIDGTLDRVHAVQLGKDDDLPYLSCLGIFQPAAWKARDGTLWFATRRGVLRTDPALIAPGTTSPPPVAITSITCDGDAREATPVLEIDSTVRRIQIRFSALNLSAPESVQVRYRLEGFDSDWVVQGQERVATYPRLPPGEYVFSTMASHGSGAWSSQPAQLTIVVTPPWWQTHLARGSGLVLLILVVALVVRAWSHRRLRRRLERVEHARAIEQERARIARNIHDDVGASLTRISLLTQAALDESSAHSPTLEKIYEATRSITRTMDEIVWAVNPRHDTTESLVYYLSNYAQSFLGAAGIRCRIESPHQAPEAALSTHVRHHLFLGCKEALNNIVRHAAATEVTIHITVGVGRLGISLADNGRGIPVGDAGPASLRNGLTNMRQRMAEIDATCIVSRGPDGGTVVVFEVPLGAVSVAEETP